MQDWHKLFHFIFSFAGLASAFVVIILTASARFHCLFKHQLFFVVHSPYLLHNYYFLEYQFVDQFGISRF